MMDSAETCSVFKTVSSLRADVDALAAQLMEALVALNQSPRFGVPRLNTDSYQIASRCTEVLKRLALETPGPAVQPPKARKGTITVGSSHGDFEIDRDGNVVSGGYKPEEGMTAVVKVNVAEWLDYHRFHHMDDYVDILDVGTWHEDGGYSGPNLKWRRDQVRDGLGELEGKGGR